MQRQNVKPKQFQRAKRRLTQARPGGKATAAPKEKAEAKAGAKQVGAAQAVDEPFEAAPMGFVLVLVSV